MPVVCFVFDPTIFKGNAIGTAVLGNFKPFAYLLSFVSVMAMSAWLIWRAKLKWLNAFLAGLFLVGGIISLGIGVVLLPVSLLGLIILIGILGLTPLFSAIVFLRNAFRAFQAAKPFLEKSVLVRTFALTVIFSAVIPSIINVEIERTLEEIANGDVQTIRTKSQILSYAAPIVNFDVLAARYFTKSKPEDIERNQVFAEEYEYLTGKSLVTNNGFMMD